MRKNEARDNGWTAELMPGESQETERGTGRLRDLESGGVKKSDPGHYPCSISAGQADGRLSAHYTSWDWLLWDRGEKKEENQGRGGGENVSLAGRSEMVPGSGDVSEGPVPLSIPPASLATHTLFLQSLRKEQQLTDDCEATLMARWLAASLCGDVVLAHKVQCVDSIYHWASVYEQHLSVCRMCECNYSSVMFSSQYDCMLAQYVPPV